MGLHVAVQIEFGEESSIAVLAEELLFTLMDHKMLIEIGLLGKRMVATWEGAVVWSLAGMDSQMVKEVMPFSEHSLAVGMSA